MADVKDNVIPLPGFLQSAKSGEPVPEIVACLESFLEKAKRGEIVGVAIASILWDGFEPREYAISTDFERSGAFNTAMALDSAIHRLSRRWANYFDGKDKG